MSYHSGVAATMPELLNALTDACTLDGWTWNGTILEKGTVFVRIDATSSHMRFLGRTSSSGGDAPGVVQIGPIGGAQITWPANYEVMIFDDEVYMVINYGVDRYQWVAFGVSALALPGTGTWLAATFGTADPNTGGGISITATSGGASNNTTSAAPFWHNQTRAAALNCWVHSNLDGHGWWLEMTGAGIPVGIRHLDPLIGLLPNTWNSEAILLPIRCYKVRPSSKSSLTVELQHARFTRIDNYEPGQVITIGPDAWKVFPFYRKNSAVRNGGNGVDHTGTFGWCIRYEGV